MYKYKKVPMLTCRSSYSVLEAVSTCIYLGLSTLSISYRYLTGRPLVLVSAGAAASGRSVAAAASPLCHIYKCDKRE